MDRARWVGTAVERKDIVDCFENAFFRTICKGPVLKWWIYSLKGYVYVFLYR